MIRPVILCVDDERIILSSLKAQLQNNLSSDFQIEVSESAEEALEITQELIKEHIEIPIVIADQIMPGMKGDELLGKIKALLPQTLTIMLTGQASADAIGKAVNKAGLFHYLSKPWDEDDLILTIQSAIDSYNHQKNLLKQSHYQTAINKTLALAIGTLNFKQQLTQSLKYLLEVPCLCPPSQGAIYLSSKSHLFESEPHQNESKQLVLKKVCEQPEGETTDVLKIQFEDLNKYKEYLFNENPSGKFSYYSYPILFDDDIVGLLIIYVHPGYIHSQEIISFLSSFSQTLSNIYRLSYSNFAFKQSNEKLKQHKLELENLVKQRTEALNNALRKQEENNAKLLKVNEELAFFATTDSLTGLLNRRHFFKLADSKYIELIEQHQDGTVAMIDVDYFKSINDKYGHQIGDQLLQKVAQTIQESFDKTAIIGRLGGEEFALLLPQADLQKAESLCDKLLKSIQNTTISDKASNISVTVSVGLTRITKQDKNIEQSLSRADKALYNAKNKGRNIISIFDGDSSCE